jgi:hypothetical protein
MASPAAKSMRGALCIDFDIAVQGVSFNQVKPEIEDAIVDYITAAREEDAATCACLLARRAPSWVMPAWSLRVLWSAWRHNSSHDTSASFPVACPA